MATTTQRLVALEAAVAALKTADTALGARIDKEVAARVVGDTALDARLDALEGATPPPPEPVPVPPPPPPPPPPVITPVQSTPITVPAGSQNLVIDGKSFTGSTGSGFGIYANGDYNNLIRNLIIRNCVFKGFNTIINAEHVQNLTIEDCVLEDAQYAGILGFSVIGGLIQRNTVRRIGMVLGGSNNNAYGIALSRNASPDFTVNPRSSNVRVAANLVEDVPLWHALDTHAGQGIIFEDNIIRRTPRAIFLTGDALGNRGLGNIARRNRLEQSVQGAGGTNKSGVTLSDQTDPTVTDNAISSTYGTPINTPSDHASSGTITISGNTTIP